MKQIIINRGDVGNTNNIASVRAYRMPDETWEKYKAVWYACEAAGCEQPETVWEFFGRKQPDEVWGVEFNIAHAVTISERGCEVDLNKLSKDATNIRFAISYKK